MTYEPTPDATAGTGLTPEQQELVLGDDGRRIVSHWLGRAPAWLKAALGADAVRGELELALVEAAAGWREGGGAAWGSYVYGGVRFRLRDMVRRYGRNAAVWHETPAQDDGGQVEPADARRVLPGGRHPALAAWADEDAIRQRRRLHLKERVVLFLRFVTCLTCVEVAGLLGVTGSRVQQIENHARTRLALARGDRRPV